MASKSLILVGKSAFKCSNICLAGVTVKTTQTAFISSRVTLLRNCRGSASGSKKRFSSLVPCGNTTLLARISPTSFYPSPLSMTYHQTFSTLRTSASIFRRETQLYGSRQAFMSTRTLCYSKSSSALFLSPQYRKRATGSLPTTDFLSYNQLLISDPLLCNQWRWRSGLSQNKTDGYRKNTRRTKESSGYFSSSLHDQSSNFKEGGKDPKQNEDDSDKSKEEPENTKKLSLYQRFKNTYKQHGKVLVGVHLFTSAIWGGTFYAAARSGIDIVPYLEKWNFSERVISPFRSGGLGHVALAYLMYKLATPARYTVTIAGTNFAIKYLRKEGKMKAIPEEDKLRSLYQEGKEEVKKKSGARIRHIRRKAKKRVVAAKKHKH